MFFKINTFIQKQWNNFFFFSDIVGEKYLQVVLQDALDEEKRVREKNEEKKRQVKT